MSANVGHSATVSHLSWRFSDELDSSVGIGEVLSDVNKKINAIQMGLACVGIRTVSKVCLEVLIVLTISSGRL